MSEAPAYRDYAPEPDLADFVHCVWTFSGPHDPSPQRIAPDGRPELIFQLRAPYAERSAEGDTAQPHVLFAGQLTSPLTLIATGPVAVIAVRFRSDAAGAFLGRDAAFATDQRVDLTNWESAEDVLEELRSVSSDAERVRIAQAFVRARVADQHIDAVARATMDALLKGDTPTPPAGVSERQWQRRFKAAVGVSPRMLQTILRFRRVFDEIEHPETKGWVEAALRAGYFDQPQMARDFRRFLGCTAREWAQSKAGLAAALAEPAPETYKKPSAA